MLRIYTLENATEWDTCVRSFQRYDVYYLSGYTRAFRAHGDGEPLLFYIEHIGQSGTLRAINVVMKRDVAKAERLRGTVPAKACYDFSTPYGYGGWLFEGNEDLQDRAEALEEYQAWCFEHRVVCEFMRFHPVLENHIACKGFYAISGLGETVLMDLQSPEAIWSNLTSKNRNVIRKATRNDVQIHQGNSPELFKVFKAIYDQTMARDDADEYYYFESAFYESICRCLPHNVLVFYAQIPDGTIISSAIILFADGCMNYHLSGSLKEYSSLDATNLLLYKAALWGYEHGFRTFHLGGGVGSGKDGLFKFKKAFNRNASLRFYVGTKVFNKPVYDDLCKKAKIRSQGETDTTFFFPAYREAAGCDDQNPKVSVIVPIYMIERYLPKCIESLVNQTYQNLEIILVDDGSSDDCPSICDEFARKDARIRVVHKQNGGLVSARKAGLEVSTGKLVSYVDGDDWVEPSFIERLAQAMVDSDADIVMDGYCRDIEDVSEKMPSRFRAGVYKEAELVEEVYPQMLCSGEYFSFGIYTYLWNKLFKRSVLYSCQMKIDNRITIGEDIAVVYPAILNAKSVAIIDACGYHYQQRAGSMLKTLESLDIENERLDILHRYLSEEFKALGYAGVMISQLDRYTRGIRLMRTGTLLQGTKRTDEYFSDRIGSKDRLAIYSAGTFGQNLFAQLEAKIGCTMTCWYDRDFEQYREQGLAVDAPEDICSASFDKICIASLDKGFIDDAIEYLLDKGVTLGQIVTVGEAFE